MITELEEPPQRLRVVVSAYACAPHCGSEPGMGWNWVINLAGLCDLTVITEEQSAASVLAELDEMDAAVRPEFHFVSIGPKARRRCGNQGDWRFYPDYERWQRRVLGVAQNLHHQHPFHLSHQLNMIGYREPGYLWKLPIPFIWGPVGGHVQMPWRFIWNLGWKSGSYHACRNVANAVQMRCSRRVHRAATIARAVISATRTDHQALTRIHGIEPILINETGTNETLGLAVRKYSGSRPLRLVWCGKIVGRKALPLALRALSSVNGAVHLDIVGRGPDEERSRALASTLGLESQLSWYGDIPHERALEIMSAADAFLFTSLQEGTPHVVHEALSLGLPVLCHDSCGHADTIDETCGIKVAVRCPAASVVGFAEAVTTLLRAPQRVETLSRGALARVQQLTWQKKARHMVSIYYAALKKQEEGRTSEEIARAAIVAKSG